MTELIPIALYGWIVVVLMMFSILPPRRAVIASFLGAWLFLPQAQIPVPGLPDVTKITVTSFGVLLGAMLFDSGRLMRFRPSWVDIPIVAWCLSPMAASLTNGLGAYDGLSACLDQIAAWGVPYLMGRLYFNDLASLRDLAIGILIGGLIYVPLCLIEVRLSPQLHRWVYGERSFDFSQTYRWGGYRPTVFMQHGLMVAIWMISATLIAAWLWMSGSLRRLCSIPISMMFGALFVTSVLCKSAGALVLMMGGLAVMVAVRYLRTPALILLLVAAPPLYITVRAKGIWDGDQLVALAAQINEQRAASLEGRFLNEVMLVDKAFGKPLFGWGTWGRWRIRDDMGRDITTADSLWIIALGQTGLAGLTSLLAVLLLPPLLLMRRVPVRHWMQPATGAAAVLAVLLVVYMLDSLLNAMVNPIFVLAAGGLSGFYVIAPALRARAESRRRAGAADRRAPPHPVPAAVPAEKTG
ncbi:MAG: O-antigen ligase domain-containing protein [Planctomycetota bacterium]|nr:O-antigen ligase domain-containing protein [Planctomycetota bacterium]